MIKLTRSSPFLSLLLLDGELNFLATSSCGRKVNAPPPGGGFFVRCGDRRPTTVRRRCVTTGDACAPVQAFGPIRPAVAPMFASVTRVDTRIGNPLYYKTFC